MPALPYSVPGDDFYVYADPTSGKLHFLPWGMDETFYSGSFDPLQVSSILALKCKDSPTCKAALIEEIWAVQRRTEDINLAAERVRVIAQIAPYVAQDVRKPYSNEQVAAYQDALYWFITERRANLTAALAPPPGTP